MSLCMTSPTEFSFMARTAPTDGSHAVRSIAVEGQLLYVVDDVLGTTLAGITFWDLSDMSSRPAQSEPSEVE